MIRLFCRGRVIRKGERVCEGFLVRSGFLIFYSFFRGRFGGGVGRCLFCFKLMFLGIEIYGRGGFWGWSELSFWNFFWYFVEDERIWNEAGIRERSWYLWVRENSGIFVFG